MHVSCELFSFHWLYSGVLDQELMKMQKNPEYTWGGGNRIPALLVTRTALSSNDDVTRSLVMIFLLLLTCTEGPWYSTTLLKRSDLKNPVLIVRYPVSSDRTGMCISGHQ